jgi:hypothetical protein
MDMMLELKTENVLVVAGKMIYFRRLNVKLRCRQLFRTNVSSYFATFYE